MRVRVIVLSLGVVAQQRFYQSPETRARPVNNALKFSQQVALSALLPRAKPLKK